MGTLNGNNFNNNTVTGDETNRKAVGAWRGKTYNRRHIDPSGGVSLFGMAVFSLFRLRFCFSRLGPDGFGNTIFCYSRSRFPVRTMCVSRVVLPT